MFSEIVDEDTEFIILASDGIWKVGSSFYFAHINFTASLPVFPLFILIISFIIVAFVVLSL